MLSKISVVMPSLNAERFIVEAIESFVTQDYPNKELIVMDGGSKDGTRGIVAAYVDHYADVMRWVQGKDDGEPDAINKGLKSATGDILTFLDADDVYAPGALSTVAGFFDSHPTTGWAYGKCRIIDSTGREIRKGVTRVKEVFQQKYSYPALLAFDFIAQPSCFWRRDAFARVGLLDVSERLVFDYDYWLRLGRLYKPGYIGDHLSSWRSHPESATSLELRKDLRDMLRIANYHAELSTIGIVGKLGISILQRAVYAASVTLYTLSKRK